MWSSLGTKPGGTFLYRGFTAAATAKAVEKARKDEKSKSDKEAAAAKKKTAEDKRKSGSAAESSTAGRSLPKDKEAAIMKDKEPETADPKGTKRDELPESLQDIVNRVKSEFEIKKKALEEANAPIIHARNDDEPCTDLILVIHGIGQNLATQYESFNFIYASNQLRQVLRKQSLDPSLSSVMRDRRLQILPVQWRANLKLESETSNENAQNERDNVFTIADITIGKSIPYVRELTNSVLLDIPLFMSSHKTQMIEAVCEQANKMYRMWIARHPEFEKNGRVHIIGHSVSSSSKTVADHVAWLGARGGDSFPPAHYRTPAVRPAQAGHPGDQEPLPVQHAQPLPGRQPARRLPPAAAGTHYRARRARTHNA